MASSWIVAVAVLAPLAAAMQPDAVPPLPAPMRPLPWGQINFLHTTDTHGWHGGHLQESQYSGDWGDYVSFAHHMRQRADADGVDLLLVDTGDRVEGNGLYDASTPKGRFTYDIFRTQPIDLLCSGNHELYVADTADREHALTVPNFAGHYLASNLDYREPGTGKQVPMAPDRYRAFTTPNQKLRVVAFGFLFNFTGNAGNSVVQPVQQTVQEDWFQHAITKEPADLFVVIGHVGARMGELRVVYEAIRAHNADTPIALFAGHAHVRDAVRFDDRAVALASGRYFETIGWMSVDGVARTTPKTPKTTASFARRYIDNNLLGLYYHSGTNSTTFPTDDGLNTTALIAHGRASLGLETALGCAPQNYWLQRRSVDDRDSLFSLLKTRILPEAVVRADRADVPRVVVMNTGSMRFDVYRGPFTIDSTYIVSPFISRVRYIQDVPYALARQVTFLLNSQAPIVSAAADWREMNVPEQYAGKVLAESILVEMDGAQTVLQSESASGPDADTRPPLVAGYTTRDDLGDDGDDAVHEPLPHFKLPNCIEAEVAFGADEPATVDLVFFDFIQAFVLQALALAEDNVHSGKHYSDADVATYIDGAFTDHLVAWIKDHWACP